MPRRPAIAIARLTDAERASALAQLPGWNLLADGHAIERSFRFADFTAAFGFMTQVTRLVEAHDHHPAWSNTYNRVTIVLTTHDASGLTRRDIALAQAINGCFAAAIAPTATARPAGAP